MGPTKDWKRLAEAGFRAQGSNIFPSMRTHSVGISDSGLFCYLASSKYISTFKPRATKVRREGNYQVIVPTYIEARPGILG